MASDEEHRSKRRRITRDTSTHRTAPAGSGGGVRRGGGGGGGAGAGARGGGGGGSGGQGRGRGRATAAAAAAVSRSDDEDNNNNNDQAQAQAQVILALREENRRQQEENRRLAAEAAIGAGTYYSTINQVWRAGVGSYKEPSLFWNLRRGVRPNYFSRPRGVNFYQMTATSAVLPAYVPATAPEPSNLSSASSLSAWPTDIFGGVAAAADIAHLIPNSPMQASMYFDVALLAFGFDPRADWETLQKAIHGSAIAPTTAPLPHTGIKHRVPNKIRMASQAACFDNRPCVLIVPILDLDAAKAWNGGGYGAIVMVEQWGEQEQSRLAPMDSASVCQSIRMLRPAVRIAEPEEIEQARTLLTHFVRGLAYSLAFRTENRRRVPDPDVYRKLTAARNTFLRSAGAGVNVPLATATHPSDLRVYVVQFKNAYGNDNQRGPPAPDPFLLATRAAVTWSTRSNQRVLAAAEPKDPEGDWDELDQLALEEHEELGDWLSRPHTTADLVRGLHRSDSYDGDSGSMIPMTLE